MLWQNYLGEYFNQLLEVNSHSVLIPLLPVAAPVWSSQKVWHWPVRTGRHWPFCVSFVWDALICYVQLLCWKIWEVWSAECPVALVRREHVLLVPERSLRRSSSSSPPSEKHVWCSKENLQTFISPQNSSLVKSRLADCRKQEVFTVSWKEIPTGTLASTQRNRFGRPLQFSASYRARNWRTLWSWKVVIFSVITSRRGNRFVSCIAKMVCLYRILTLLTITFCGVFNFL